MRPRCCNHGAAIAGLDEDFLTVLQGQNLEKQVMYYAR